MVNFILNNLEVILSIVFFILGFVFGDKFKKTTGYIVDVGIYAWNRAEQEGILRGWKGWEKLAYFMDIVENIVQKDKGRELTTKEEQKLIQLAEDLSIKDKVIRQNDPNFFTK